MSELIGPEHQRRVLGEIDSLKKRARALERLAASDALKFAEITTAPTAADVPDNQAWVYAVDNGAGKTSLRVQFSTGAAQTIATEP